MMQPVVAKSQGILFFLYVLDVNTSTCLVELNDKFIFLGIVPKSLFFNQCIERKKKRWRVFATVTIQSFDHICLWNSELPT